MYSNLEGSRLRKDKRGEGKRNENEQKLQSQRNKECRLLLDDDETSTIFDKAV